jgi:tetratricopeptide (TPR) repeat protein
VVRQRIRRAYGFAVAERLPLRARAAFMAVLKDNPADPEALYGCGMLDDRKGDQVGAYQYFTRALEAAPGFEEARRFRALVLARRGDYQAARVDINVCLSKESPTGATYYAAACVAAIQAEKSDPQSAAECTQAALEMLHEAFVRGYGLAIANTDPDLNGIRNHPEFGRLVSAGPRLAEKQ